MAGGQSHTYQVTLAAGEFLHVVVEQRGIDVVVALFAPDGKQVIEVDSAAGTQGHESVFLIAELAGGYRLEVRSLAKATATGKYEASIAQMRAPSAQDSSLITAQTVFAEGEQLRARDEAESLQSSINKYEEARSLYRSIGNHEGEANALSKLGEVHNNTGEIKKALDEWSQVLALRRAAGDRGGEAHALSILGAAYEDLGEQQKALDYDNQALLLDRDLGDRPGEADVLINIGLIYYTLRELEKALSYYNQALSLSHALGYFEGEGFAHQGLAATYTYLGEKRKALDYGNQALSLSRAIGAHRLEAYSLHHLAWIYGDMGEKQKALEYNHQALPLMREVGDRRGEAYILHSLGWIHDTAGEKRQAIDYYNQALPLRRKVGDYLGEADTLNRLAHCERELGNLGKARAHIDATINLIESFRTKLGSQDLRANYIAFAQGYYEFYLDLLAQLHQRSPTEGYNAAALQISERARARNLLELLIEARADIRQGVDAALLERERDLRQTITARTDSRIRLLNGKHTEQQATQARLELAALTSAYQEIEAKIRTTSPRYAALTQPQTLTLPEIKQLLDPDTLLVEYALGKESVIHVAAQRVYELMTARTQKLANETAAQRGARIAKADAQYHTAAAELSQMLLAPVAAQLGHKRLVVVADGVLQYIPFAALPEPVSGGPTTRPAQPLIAEHELVSLPSASTLAVLRRELSGRRPAPKTAAVLADPVFEPTDLRVRAARQPSGAATGNAPSQPSAAALVRALDETGLVQFGQGIPRLPYTQREAAVIKALVPESQRKLALGFAASYATATSPELSQYRIVHFATHGLLDSQQPELSGMLLSLVDEQGRPQENGFLRFGEIYNLKLPAELVVLSACQTALGQQIRGEGLVGLTRGFMYAGAARVLATLWKVDDAATAELMQRFYEGMLGPQHLPAAAALRQAQLALWRKANRRAPYYWGAFTIQGEWR